MRGPLSNKLCEVLHLLRKIIANEDLYHDNKEWCLVFLFLVILKLANEKED